MMVFGHEIKAGQRFVLPDDVLVYLALEDPTTGGFNSKVRASLNGKPVGRVFIYGHQMVRIVPADAEIGFPG